MAESVCTFSLAETELLLSLLDEHMFIHKYTYNNNNKSKVMLIRSFNYVTLASYFMNKNSDAKNHPCWYSPVFNL